jgi:hypothetical protein
VTAWAKELRKAGLEGGMDLLTEPRGVTAAQRTE